MITVSKGRRRAVAGSATIAVLLLLTACQSVVGAGSTTNSSQASATSSAGAAGSSVEAPSSVQTTTSSQDDETSSAQEASSQDEETSSAQEASSQEQSPSTQAASSQVGGTSTDWDGSWGGAAQEPQTHSANDTVPLTFTVQGGTILNFTVTLWPGTCGTTVGDPAFVTDAPIVGGKVDKTTVLAGSNESTTRVVGYFGDGTAYGTVFYVMPGVCDSTQWTWKATKTAG